MNIKAPNKADIPALRSLWKEAFGDSDKFLDEFFSKAFASERAFCVKDDDKIVAALYWFDCQYNGKDMAYLYAIATAREYRGQGICHKLMEHTHTHLARLGYVGALLVPGSESLFRFYESVGYEICSYINELKCSAVNGKAELCKIDKDEYATIRRELLPNDAVVQEGKNIDFLATQADFYKGSGFLLAARIEGDTLYGVELLGATDRAEAIVYSLGCREGLFRVPGDTKPFAMRFPFDCGIKPSYFGLAFD